MLLNPYRFTPAGVPGLATYWRLRLVGQNATFNRAGEIEFRDVAAGTDLCVGGTATASHTLSTNVASRAFDNNVTTEWVSTSAAEHWIKYQFTTAVAPQELYYYFRDTQGATQSPKDIYIEYSFDNSSWVTIASYLGEAPWSANTSRTFFIQ